MIVFPTGIEISQVEYQCLLHVVADPEQWLGDAIKEKGLARRDALIAEWRPKLFTDVAVTSLPADSDELASLILARSDYMTRNEQEAKARLDPKYPVMDLSSNQHRYETREKSGKTQTLFASGIEIDQVQYDCILAYVDNLEDWIYGALLGHINRGLKKMVQQYNPVLMADPEVVTIPATQDGMIELIAKRNDYRTLPQQVAERLAGRIDK